MRFVLLAFLIWRILLFIPLFLGNIFLVQRSGYAFSGINNNLFSPWANFDGIHYLTIAANGYTTEANFLPLFTILIKVFSPVFGFFFSGFLIANLSFLFALIIFYKLILLDYSSSVAKQTIIFLLLFPTSFYFGSIYTESLFLLLIVCSFYFARKGNLIVSSVFAMFSSVTRLPGIVMLPVLLYQYIVKKGFQFSIRLLFLLLVPIGLISYAIFNFYKWGDFFYFIKAHGNLLNSRSVDNIILFPQTILRYINILVTVPTSQYEWWIALMELSIFFIISILFYIAWKKKIEKSYLLYALLAFLLPVFSGTFSGLPRYVITLFPIFITIALIQNWIFKLTYIIVSPILLFILLMFFARGYFIA